MSIAIPSPGIRMHKANAAGPLPFQFRLEDELGREPSLVTGRQNRFPRPLNAAQRVSIKLTVCRLSRAIVLCRPSRGGPRLLLGVIFSVSHASGHSLLTSATGSAERTQTLRYRAYRRTLS